MSEASLRRVGCGGILECEGDEGEEGEEGEEGDEGDEGYSG